MSGDVEKGVDFTDEPSPLPPAPNAELPAGEFSPEEQLARMPPPRDPRPEPRISPAPPPPGWQPTRARDVDDAGLLSQEVRLLRGEVGGVAKDMKNVVTAIETLTNRVLPLLQEHDKRITVVEHRVDDFVGDFNTRLNKNESDIKAALAKVAKLETAAAKRLKRK